MAWRDRLLPASFRGVAFSVDSSTLSGGRRAIQNEYPGRDLPGTQDQGRSPRNPSFSAYVLGPNYMDARDALLDALEQEGPGLLIHPYCGPMMVQTGAYTLEESWQHGGQARFTLEFFESGELVQPSATVSTASALRQTAADAKAQASADFASRWDVSAASWVRTNATARVRQAMRTVRNALKPLRGVAGVIDEVVLAIDEIDDTAASLIGTPALLAASLIEAFDSVTSLDVFRLLSAGSGVADAGTYPTTAEQDDADNAVELDRLIVRVALAEACTLIADTTFASRTEAEAARDLYASRITLETEAGRPESGSYQALVDMRTALAEDIAERAASLRRLVDYTPTETTSALAIAQRHHRDGSRASEIIDRNTPEHPGFIGSAVKVLAEVA